MPIPEVLIQGLNNFQINRKLQNGNYSWGGNPLVTSEQNVIIGSPMNHTTQQLLSKIIDRSVVLQALKQNGADTSRTQVFRAAILFFFENLDNLKDNAEILVGASTPLSMDRMLKQTLKGMKKR